jgi:type IV pilus assembly protein PilM
MSAVAIDVGTYTIKAIHAKPGKKPEIERTVEVFNTAGISLPTDEASTEKLGQLIEALLSDHKLPRKDIRLALPEQAVSTKIISIPPLSDAELASAIGWQAEQHIPIPLEELALEYQVLSRPAKGDQNQNMQVLLIGARKKIVENYSDLFFNLGIEPTLLETQSIATIRSLQFTSEDATTMIVSIGAATMDMAVVRQGQLAFVYSHLNGGQLLTKTIEQQIGLDTEQSEQYKRTYGLDETQFEGKIRAALEPTVKIYLGEIMKAMQFFVNNHAGESVQRILLTGGTAQLPGLIQYITSALNVEVLVAAPFATATGEIPQVNHPAFTVCMGLIMKEL